MSTDSTSMPNFEVFQEKLPFGIKWKETAADVMRLAASLTPQYSAIQVYSACEIFKAAVNGNKALLEHALVVIEPEITQDALNLLTTVLPLIIQAVVTKTPIALAALEATCAPILIADATKIGEDALNAVVNANPTPTPTN